MMTDAVIINILTSLAITAAGIWLVLISQTKPVVMRQRQ